MTVIDPPAAVTGDGERPAGASSKHVFVALDGLRGVAAPAVVLLHAATLLGIAQFDGGNLAVDLFFAMSGVVIAHAYEDRLRAGMPMGTFTQLRLIRLYPLYALTTLALGAIIAASLLHGMALDRWNGPTLARVLGLGLLGLPATLRGSEDLYPLNAPAWSLLFEIGVNLAYAAGGFRLGRVGLASWVAAGGAAIIALWALGYSPLTGFSHATWPMGAARALYAFPIGIVIFRRWRRAPEASRLPGWLPYAGFVACAVGVSLLPAAWRDAGALAALLVACPGLVWLATSQQPGRGRTLCLTLGVLSYPIYLVHTVVLHLAFGVERVAIAHHVATAPWLGLGCLLAIGVIGWAVERWVDRPLRAWLRDRVKRRWWVRRVPQGQK